MKTKTELKLDCAAKLLSAYEGLIEERKNYGASRSDENIEYFLRQVKEYEKQMTWLMTEETKQN